MKVPIFLIVFVFSAICLFSQVPNNDFEIWDSTAGYKVPVGWDNLNPLTHSSGVLTCQRMPLAYSGEYYIGLNTEMVPGMGIVGGIAVSGKLDPVTHRPRSGFPYTARPQVLAGAWQYMPYTWSDQGYLSVLLSKWNISTSQRDTVAFTEYWLPGMVMAWTPFALPLNYHSSAYPDSAMIVLSASGPTPVEYSFFWVDLLRFGDSATLGAIAPGLPRDLPVFPNPAKDKITIVYPSAGPAEITVAVTDVAGRKLQVAAVTARRGENRIDMDTHLLGRGIYFITITAPGEVRQQKIVIE